MGRPTQPSGTNRPSSYSIPPPAGAGRACGRGPGPGDSLSSAVRPSGHGRAGPADENAPCWPAAMAGEAHPVPSRTRKLSPLAPMVLRCSPWESRTPPASKGRSPLHMLRPAPGISPRGPFLFCRAARPRRDRASPQNGPPGALFCENARSRRPSSCPARPLLACLGADAPPLTGRMTGRDGPFPSFRARAIGPPRGVDGHVRGLVLVFDCVIRPYPGIVTLKARP